MTLSASRFIGPLQQIRWSSRRMPSLFLDRELSAKAKLPSGDYHSIRRSLLSIVTRKRRLQSNSRTCCDDGSEPFSISREVLDRFPVVGGNRCGGVGGWTLRRGWFFSPPFFLGSRGALWCA